MFTFLANHPMLQVLLLNAFWAVFGLCLMLGAYKVYDLITPFDTATELAGVGDDAGNIAVAIVIASFNIGIAMIISAALN